MHTASTQTLPAVPHKVRIPITLFNSHEAGQKRGDTLYNI